jgi:hypothetical protein
VRAALKLPDWVSKVVVVVLILGFPRALLFAWIQDLGGAHGIAPATGKLDVTLASALIAVIGLLAYERFTSLSLPGAESGVTAARKSGLIPAPRRP